MERIWSYKSADCLNNIRTAGTTNGAKNSEKGRRYFRAHLNCRGSEDPQREGEPPPLRKKCQLLYIESVTKEGKDTPLE